jgi:hypothetical protein
MEGSLVAYKVFTNGSVLQASEINDNLMRQSVMVFSNAAARTAAITSPVEGMLTWLEDLNRYESYNGSNWVSPFGTTLLVNTSFSSVASFSVNDVFSSQFRNYKIVFTGGTATDVADLNLRLRVAGADTTTGYNAVRGLLGGSYDPRSRQTGGAGTSMALVSGGGFSGKFCDATIYAPFVNESTCLTSYGGHSQGVVSFCSSDTSGTGSFTGFTLLASTGNITGNLQVYGLRN